MHICMYRLELIDDAMLRPGRLGKLLYVPLPTPSDRVGILTALTRKVELAPITTTAVAEGEEQDEVEKGVDITKIATDPRTDGAYTNTVYKLIFALDFQLNFVLILASFCFSSSGFSGADLSALVREAGLAVVKERYRGLSLPNSSSSTFQPVPLIKQQQHNMICSRRFEAALNIVRPSVTAEDRIR